MLLFKHGTVQPDLAIVFGRSWRESPGRHMCEVAGQGLKCLGQIFDLALFGLLESRMLQFGLLEWSLWGSEAGLALKGVCSFTKVWVAFDLAKHWQNTIYQTY